MASHNDGYAVIQSRLLFGVFPTWAAAFDAAIKKYGTLTPFLIRRIEVDE